MLDLLNDSAISEAWLTFLEKGCAVQNPVKEITVVNRAVGWDNNEAKTFKGSQWRQAILIFLFKRWRGRSESFHMIRLDGIILWLWGSTYYVYSPLPHDDDSNFTNPNHWIVLDFSEDGDESNNRDHVEIGLVRFVKDESLGQLCIRFKRGRMLAFSKGNKRGELMVYTQGIPVWDGKIPKDLLQAYAS
ncbi:MAG: hypothetical protein NUV53_04075 [Patescibacteria group bacterium]|nr:hypothetical protein [Patescibacteria group bacterium]